MPYDFDKVIDRYNTGCEKYDTAVQKGYPADVLPMWVADMDFQTAPCVQEALHGAVEHGIFGYSTVGADYFPPLRDWFAEKFGWEVEQAWLQTTPGVVYALSIGVQVMTREGDGVLIQTPVYYPFYRVITQNGRRIVENPLRYENGRYSIDFQDMEQKIRENNVKLLILCSPHNPVCRVWTQEELVRIGRLCEQYGVGVISDEIHCDFAFPEHPHIPFLKACPSLAERCILCTAPSKSFNLAGLQVSNIFIPGEGLRGKFSQALEQASYFGPNLLGTVACKAAYTGGGQWLEECKAYMRENLRYVRTFLREKLPQLRLVEPEGTYFAWIDCAGMGLSQQELEDFFPQKAKLWLDNGSIFGQCAAQFQRVVLACPRETVKKAMDRLYAAAKEQGYV